MRSLDEIRSHFPALSGQTAFLENAGGSQVPRQTIDAVKQYFESSYVQLGASYPESVAATKVVADAHEAIRRYAGAGDYAGGVLGASSSALCAMLADCYAKILKPGDAVVIAESGHEANIGPWARLAAQGIEVRWWPIDRYEGDVTVDGLNMILDERVKLIACCQVSNLLGGIVDLAPIVKRAKEVGARVVVDGVAFAPHRPIEFDKLGVDFYVYSTYKVFGPHMGAMIGKKDAWAELTGPNHFFMPREYFPGKFELGGPSHEGCAAILGSMQYLEWLGEGEASGALATTFEHEMALAIHLLDYLASREDIRLIGRRDNRVATVSWVQRGVRSRDVVLRTDPAGVAIRWGHMYSYRLLQSMGIDPEEGVVRASMVHYNTIDEVDRLIRALDA